MSDDFVTASYQRLDKGLKRALRGTIAGYAALLASLAKLEPTDAATICLWRWAMFYTVILKDLANTADRLLVDGKHSRAVTLLRRVAFEYVTRFDFYWTHPEQAKTALDEFNPDMEKFASRLGPDDITILLDPTFNRASHDDAAHTYRTFLEVAKAVYGDKALVRYARYYQYPSFLLHGSATASIDVLELRNDKAGWRVHLDSRRPYTNELASNLIVFLIDFATHVAQAFDLNTLEFTGHLGSDFNATRTRLGIELGD